MPPVRWDLIATLRSYAALALDSDRYIRSSAAACHLTRAAVRGASVVAAIVVLCFACPPLTALDAAPELIPGTGGLAADNAYLAHGAITTMETCLRVAEDRNADVLWAELKPRHGAGPEVLDKKDRPSAVGEDATIFEEGPAEEVLSYNEQSLPPSGDASNVLLGLKGRPVEIASEQDGLSLVRFLLSRTSDIDQERRETAYSTVYTCANIQDAWNARLPPVDDRQNMKSDGSIEHGVVVIDLKNQAIDPISLSRIITAPTLLPPVASGGILIKNAEFTRPLVLADVNLTIPLTFHNVVFRGGAVERAYLEDDRTDQRSTLVARTRFSHSIVFSRSVFCDPLVVVDSKFSKNLTITGSRFGSDKCDEETERKDETEPKERPFLLLQTSTAAKVAFSESEFGAVFVAGNEIDEFNFWNSNIRRTFEFFENQDTAFYFVQNTVHLQAEISNNAIGRTLRFEKPVLLGNASVSVSGNLVNGTFVFEGWRIVGHEPEVGGRPQLFLSGNNIDSGARICFPTEWFGNVDLSGNNIQGTLEFYLFADAPSEIETDHCLNVPPQPEGRDDGRVLPRD